MISTGDKGSELLIGGAKGLGILHRVKTPLGNLATRWYPLPWLT